MPTPEQEQLPKPFSNLIEDNPGGVLSASTGTKGNRGRRLQPRSRPGRLGGSPDGGLGGHQLPHRARRLPDGQLLTGPEARGSAPRRDREDQHPAFGVWVQPETCTVRVESDLLSQSEVRALVDRYGKAISFDTTEGSAGEQLTLID